MGGKTLIQWTERTWNYLRGCSKALMPGPNGKPVLRQGCKKCYAMKVAGRFSGKGLPYEGLAIIHNTTAEWTGKVSFVEKHLLDPLRWTNSKIFVNSMSDLFHANVKEEWIDLGFAVMLLCPHSIFQTLTKRPDRMRDYINGKQHLSNSESTFKSLAEALYKVNDMSPKLARKHGIDPLRVAHDITHGDSAKWWPAKHIHLGASIEDQPSTDYTMPILYETHWPMLWISGEPLLGEIDLERYLWEISKEHGGRLNRLKWAVIGSESGTGARTAELDWFRLLRDQCVAADVPLFLKQFADSRGHKIGTPELDGVRWMEYPE